MASQIGALANLQQQTKPLFETNTPNRNLNESNATANERNALGQAMRPTQAPADPEQVTQRYHENRQWLQDPKTQAALLAFAVNIMQPLGGTGGAGDFVGALGRSLGAGAEAAANVENSALAEDALVRQQELDERKMGNEERQTDLQERELTQKEGKLGQRVQKKIVGVNDPLNKQFNLGITGPSQAVVEVTYGPDGKVIGATIDKQFNEQGISSTITSGQELQVDEQGNKSIKVLPGGKAEREKLEADAAAAQRQTSARIQAQVVNGTIQQSMDMIKAAQNPDVTITGWGSYLSLLPATDAKTLQENLKTIKANVGFDKLQSMREASPTGAALGPVSDFENQLLQATIGSLDQAQKGQQLVDNLNRVKIIYEDIIGTGELATLNQMVKNQQLTPEQAQIHANKLIDEKLGLNTNPDPDQTIKVDAPDTPPPGLPEEYIPLWPYYTEQQKLETIQILKNQKAREGMK